MMFNLFALAVAACALASRHHWKEKCKTAELFCDELASSVIQGIERIERAKDGRY